MLRGLAMLLWAALTALLVFPAFRRELRRPPPDELVKDPVCQTYVVRSRAVTRTDGGEARYFCSAACARRFAAGVNG